MYLKKLAAIGECMLELSGKPSSDAGGMSQAISMSYGGDTLNTLIYVSRMGLECAFFTGLGTDPYSDWLMQTWQAEGINTDYVRRLEDKLPGIYAIQLSDDGERSFHYWRKDSAASCFMARTDANQLFTELSNMDVVYLSGITLGVIDDAQREMLIAIIAQLKKAGVIIAFDGNFRPRNWESKAQAQQWILKILDYVDWYLPTFDDEQMLFDFENIEALIAFYANKNISELVVKNGEAGCVLVAEADRYASKLVAIPQKVIPIDTTAAGDSFNAAYVASRMQNNSPEASALAGHRLAAEVIQHKGAIIPRHPN